MTQKITNFYCYHQYIKYIPWDKNDYSELRDLNTAVERWSSFLTLASDQTLKAIRYFYIY